MVHKLHGVLWCDVSSCSPSHVGPKILRIAEPELSYRPPRAATNARSFFSYYPSSARLRFYSFSIERD